MEVAELVEHVGEGVEVVGVAVIVLGVVASMIAFAAVWIPREPADVAYRHVRRSLGRSILLGLEILVAGDIIRTVALEPTFTSVGVLGIVVLIRTFLSFALEVEITGRWPWQGEDDREHAVTDGS